MESRIWKIVLSVLPRTSRRSTRRDYDLRVILQVLLWSVLHDRPIAWACDPENWSPRFRPRVLPHPSTMSRRLREPDIKEWKQRIHQRVLRRLGTVVNPTRLAFIDGRALPVRRQSLDPDATNGRGSGGFERGYKLHAITGSNQVFLTFDVCPLNVSEKVVARHLIANCDASITRIIGDGAYDSVPLHEAADRSRRRLYAPVRQRRVGRRANPYRLRARRFFVAAYPPPDLVVEMAKLGRMHANEHDVRFTPEEQVHLTLQFIGETSVGEIENTIESVFRACQGIASFSVRPTRVITLPRKPRATPRLIAIETDAPASLLEVHRRLAHRFARRPRRDPGDRFLPHLTLCRFRPGVLPTPVEEIITHLPSFDVTTVKLMRSRLRPTGAIHENVATIPLDAS